MVRRIAVLIYDGVTLLDVAGPVEVFTDANSAGQRYEVSMVAAGGGVAATYRAGRRCRRPSRAR